MPKVVLGAVYLLLIYKIVLIMVMWRASINYKKFVAQQRNLVGLR